MSVAEAAHQRLRTQILRPVSRSFYLSIQFLPAPLRDPIALAYLLARATDTVADAHEFSVTERQEQLMCLAAAIQGESFGETAWLWPTDPSERKLIEALPTSLTWLETMPPNDRSKIRTVLARINRGQSLDLQRFGEANEIHALQTAAELDEYTYLVAGCVGEFWTRECLLHLKNFADRSENEMIELGVAYGKGLQLINILRDAGDDLRAGRCYLPREGLDSLGISPAEILREPQSAEPLLAKWRGRAEQGINCGLEYAASIRNFRVRFATALPALIGARTLELLREAGPQALRSRLKIPRSEIRRILISTLLHRASPRYLLERRISS